MNADFQIPGPFLFNPIKHHLGFLRDFISLHIDRKTVDTISLTRDINHIGSSVMDIYTGSLSINNICSETAEFLKSKDIFIPKKFAGWTGINAECFRIVRLSDGSQWTIKYHNNPERYVHIFPSRNSQHTFRVKSNTLKSALIYLILIGKDLVTGDDLNVVRPVLGLSPVKNSIDTEAILEMIEILRK